MVGEQKDWQLKDGAVIGFALWPVAAIIVIPLAIAVGPWYLWVLIFPAMPVASIAISFLADLSHGNGAAARAVKTLGLVTAVVAGIGLIWFGITVNVDNPPCDPAVSRCVTVINGVASGESTESTGSQAFGTFMTSLIAIVPGLALLGVVARAGYRAALKRWPHMASDADDVD